MKRLELIIIGFEFSLFEDNIPENLISFQLDGYSLLSFFISSASSVPIPGESNIILEAKLIKGMGLFRVIKS